MYNIGVKIKEVRKSKGISQAQLSNNFLNRVTLSNIENNKQEPSLSQLIHICKQLNINLNNLIFESSDNVDCFENLYTDEDYYDLLKEFEFNPKKFKDINDDKKFYHLGVAYYKNNLLLKSNSFLNKYVNIFLKNDAKYQKMNIKYFCESLNYLFKINYKKNASDCIKHLELATTFISKYKIDSEEISLKILSNICAYYLEKRLYKKIIEHCAYFDNFYQEICYPLIFINILKALAIAYSYTFNYNKSIYYTKKVIALYQYLDDDFNEGYSYINSIYVYRLNSKFDEALYTTSFVKREFHKYSKLINIFNSEEVNIYFNLKNYNEAFSLVSNVNDKDLTTYGKTSFHLIKIFLSIYLNGTIYTEKYLLKFEKFLLNNFILLDLYVLYGCLYFFTKKDTYLALQKTLNFDKIEKNIFISFEEANEFSRTLLT
ncbi:MAG: helix-turn-helix domain-containing protein [Clostridium sp.]